MFERLGVVDAVTAKALVPKALLMLDFEDAGEIVRIPTGDSFRRRFGAPYVVIHRVDLHRVLLDACAREPGIELMPLASARSFEERAGGVRLTLDDGRTLDGCAVIGADGLRSTVRQQMLDEGEPRMVGYVAHRTIVPMADVTADVPREEVVLWSGDGFHIVHYPLRDSTLFNIVAVFQTSTYAERGDIEGYRAELDRTYRCAHPSMKALLTMMDLERRWAISDRDPVRTWSRGRVTLLGDAAHPPLQSLAQGACMAIEDAVSLAEFMAGCGGDFAAAFRRYERARYLRTARVQYESRYMWDNFYHLGGIEREVMRSAWAGRTEDEHFRCLSWLYGGFPLPDRKDAAA
jgi:3-hydroxybenzoate 6-monooxygenase